MAGPRARLGPAVFGFDALVLRERDFGFEASFGLTDRPGKYALGISAIVGAIVLVFALSLRGNSFG